MFEVYLGATAVLLVAGVLVGYRRTHDVLHPMIFLGPMFLFGTVLDPWLVRGELSRYLRNGDDVLFVLALNAFAVGALVAGALHQTPARPHHRLPRARSVLLSQQESTLLLRVALCFGSWALASYLVSIDNAGGFVAAYSQAKGGGFSASGYVSEGMNLSLVTAAMVAVARVRRGWNVTSAILLGLGLLPNFLQGTFGGRRGPLFLSLTAAMLAWLVVRVRRPHLWMIGSSLAAAALAVSFVASQRQFLYLGSEETVRWDEFTQSLVQDSADEGNNFIYGAAFVTTVRRAGTFTWGRELAVNLLVRPIPRQLWPTKYEDTGATWVTSDYPGLGHVTQADWLAAVGWLPLAGSSAISISDLYGEFGWGAVAALYVIGRGFAELYRRRGALGGQWQLLYLEALMLSIYLATQSFSSFYHRFLILAVPTVLAWKYFLKSRHTSHALLARSRHRVSTSRRVAWRTRQEPARP